MSTRSKRKLVRLPRARSDGSYLRRTIRIKYGVPDDALLQARPELVFANELGTMRWMQKIQARLRQRGDPAAGNVPAPYMVRVVTKDGKVHRGIPPIEEWGCIVSFRAFVENVVSCLSDLRKRQNDQEVREEDVREMRALAELLFVIHIAPPGVKKDARQFLWDESRAYMLGRIGGWHNLSLGKHVLLSPAKGAELHALICRTIYEGDGTPERLREVSGDMHFGNLLKDPEGNLYAIDPRVRKEFPQVADPGMDVGFLVTDLWWFYRVFENPLFKELARLLIEAYEEIARDTKIRLAAAEWGVPYRTAMRLKSEYVKKSELLCARSFVEDMRKWMTTRLVDVSL